MTCINTNRLFIIIDAEEAGRMIDGAVFKSSTLERIRIEHPNSNFFKVRYNVNTIQRYQCSIPQVMKDNSMNHRIPPAQNRQPNRKSSYELRDYLKSYFERPENALS